MKFAVVEYSSKSGKIWRHTDDKPNFLCDPDGAIDPTSFGCYVSALKGDHIPLTLVLGAKQLNNRLIRKLTGSWPDNYSLAMFTKYDVLMVVYEVANGPTLTRFIEKIKKAYPAIKIMGVPTQPYGLIKVQWQDKSTILADLKKFMSVCDIFITIVESTKPAWQKLNAVPVRYLPQPYPVEFAASFHQLPENKRDIIYVAGVTDRPNITKGLMVAKQIQSKMPRYKIHVTSIQGINLDDSALQNTDYEIIKFMPWQEHLGYLSKVKVVINTDYTQTRGRVQMDCAAVGTPSVGADSDAQLDLFPELASDTGTSVEELTDKTMALLTTPPLYEKTTSYAKGKLQFYNYPNSASRLQQLANDLSQ